MLTFQDFRALGPLTAKEQLAVFKSHGIKGELECRYKHVETRTYRLPGADFEIRICAPPESHSV